MPHPLLSRKMRFGTCTIWKLCKSCIQFLVGSPWPQAVVREPDIQDWMHKTLLTYLDFFFIPLCCCTLRGVQAMYSYPVRSETNCPWGSGTWASFSFFVDSVFSSSFAYYCFFESRFFSHIIQFQAQFPLPPLLPTPSPFFSPSDPLYLGFFCRKEPDSKTQQPNTAAQDAIRQGKIPHVQAGQGDPAGGKESQEQARESETLPQLGVPQKHQANS